MGALAGCGFPAPLLLLTVVGQFATPPEFIGTSTALLLSLRALGSAVGSVVSQVIASSKQSVKIPGYTAEATLPLGLDPSLLGTVITAATGNPQLIAEISAGQVPGVSPEVLAAAFEAVHRAFSDSYKYVYIAAVPFCVIGTASILTLKRNKGQQDYIVDAPLQDIHHRHADKEAAGV